MNKETAPRFDVVIVKVVAGMGILIMTCILLRDYNLYKLEEDSSLKPRAQNIHTELILPEICQTTYSK